MGAVSFARPYAVHRRTFQGTGACAWGQQAEPRSRWSRLGSACAAGFTCILLPRGALPCNPQQLALHATFYDGRLLLSRPDQHVAWRGDRVPEDPTALIDRVRGAAI